MAATHIFLFGKKQLLTFYSTVIKCEIGTKNFRPRFDWARAIRKRLDHDASHILDLIRGLRLGCKREEKIERFFLLKKPILSYSQFASCPPEMVNFNIST